MDITGLQAFEKIMKIYGDTNSLEGTYELFLKIKQDLERLEASANVNKKLRIDISNLNSSYLDISKENEKLKKALFITYMKTVDLELLKDCFELKDYNDRVNFFKELTQQEYELLKEVLEND